MTKPDRRGALPTEVGCLRQAVPSLRKGDGGHREGWSDGGRAGEIASRTTGRTGAARMTARSIVPALTMGSVQSRRPRSRMREIRTSGSVGALGEILTQGHPAAAPNRTGCARPGPARHRSRRPVIIAPACMANARPGNARPGTRLASGLPCSA
jgi:hypothetical protein